MKNIVICIWMCVKFVGEVRGKSDDLEIQESMMKETIFGKIYFDDEIRKANIIPMKNATNKQIFA